MTRENKLGLLIGMAFVIVIGILISDHISSTNEPIGAPLRAAGDMLRSGLGQPGSDDVAPVLRVPQAITPKEPVVINEELKLHSEQPPVHFVAPAPHGQAITPDPSMIQTPVAGNTMDRIRQAAQQNGEELIPAENNPVVTRNSEPPVAAGGSKTAPRTYEAQPGDSLSTIAREVYGSSCRANCEAIVAANPSLTANRDLIIAGRSYVIPDLGTPATTATATATATGQQSAALKSAALKSAATTAGLQYTVKPHDTLWSIAISEVGTPGAVSAIKDLNKEILNGSDRVRPNMKLTLPSKKKINDE